MAYTYQAKKSLVDRIAAIAKVRGENVSRWITTQLEQAVQTEEKSPILIRFVQEVAVEDPDTKGMVVLAIYRLETGPMVGIDTSYVAERVAQVFSPYDIGIRLQGPDLP